MATSGFGQYMAAREYVHRLAGETDLRIRRVELALDPGSVPILTLTIQLMPEQYAALGKALMLDATLGDGPT